MFIVTTSSLTLTSCLSSGESSSASSSSSSTSSAMYWNTSAFPLSIKASEDFSVSERTLLNDMAVEWEDLGVQGSSSDDVDFFSASIGGTLTDVADPSHSNVNSYRDNTLGIYMFNTWPTSFSSSALAVTQLFGIRGDGIQLSHGDIFFNQQNYSFYTDVNDAGNDSNAYDMGTIALHELGHLIGINHISNVPSNSAVMYPYLGASTVKRTVRDCDLKAVATNYGWTTDSTLCPEIESLETDDQQDLTPMTMTAGITEEQLDAAGIENGDQIGIVMELRTDGTCHHMINGHEVHVHNVDLR